MKNSENYGMLFAVSGAFGAGRSYFSGEYNNVSLGAFVAR
jgi:hypothetical protein